MTRKFVSLLARLTALRTIRLPRRSAVAPFLARPHYEDTD